MNRVVLDGKQGDMPVGGGEKKNPFLGLNVAGKEIKICQFINTQFKVNYSAEVFSMLSSF